MSDELTREVGERKMTGDSAQHGRVAVGHPVDVATGRLYHDFEDFVQPGRMPIVFSRRYSSTLTGKGGGMFGEGWSSPFGMRVRRTLDGYAVLDEDGEREIVIEDWSGRLASGGVLRAVSGCCELWQEGEELVARRWRWDSDEVVELRFEPERRPDDRLLPEWVLRSRQDLEGNGLDLERDELGRVVAVRQRRERRSLELTYDRDGHVVEVQVVGRPAARPKETPRRAVLRYRYEAGRLVEMEDALGQRCRYEYDAAGRMSREVNLGGMAFTFTTDRDGRCVETSGENDFGRARLTFYPMARRTLAQDSLDGVTAYHWNARGQVERIVSPLGHSTMTVFDDEARIVQEVTAEGATTAYEFDERGDRVKVTSPTGAVTHYEYSELHQLVAVTDPAGGAWRRTYDADRRVVEVANPLGETLTYVYGAEGDLVAVVDAAGHRRELEWSAAGDLVSATDFAGNRTCYEHDLEGRLVAVVDPLGQRTEARLDALGRVVEVRLPDGATRHFRWDAYDQPTRYIDENEAVTEWRYQACGLLTDVVRPTGGRLRFDWSSIPGQLIGVVNERGERWQLTYDAAGHLVREKDFAGRQTSYRCDKDGQVQEVVDAAGQRTVVQRDASGAVTDVEHDGDEQSGAQYAYDARGLLVRAANATCVVERSYDAVGRLVREARGEHTVESEYDRCGNRVRRRSKVKRPGPPRPMTVPFVQHETTFAWDENGQIAELGWGPGQALPFSHDARQDEAARHVPGGVSIEQSFDARGRRQAQSVWKPGAPRGDGGEGAVVSRRYGYDAASNLVRIDDALWGRTDHAYDLAGRLTLTLLPSSAERFAYDPTDNIVSSTQARTDTEWRYEPGNQLSARGAVRYEHDALGQLAAKTDERGETRYEWDRFGQLVGVRLPGDYARRWRYSYDALGRRVRKWEVGDFAGRPWTEFVWDGDVVLHELRGTSGADDKAEIVQWEYEPDSFAPIGKRVAGQLYLAVNDVAGNPRELVTATGEVVWAAQYSSWGEVTTRVAEVDCPVRYQGQWADDETGLCYNRFRYYDPATGRFISEDPTGLLGGLNVYRFVPDPSGWIDPYGLANVPCHLLRQIVRSWKSFTVRSWKEFHTLISPTRLVVTEYHFKDLLNIFGRYNGKLNLLSASYWRHVLPHHHVYTSTIPPPAKANMRKAFKKAGAFKSTHSLLE